MSALGGLKTSLVWCERIAASSKDPKQRERLLARAMKLRAQIEAHTTRQQRCDGCGVNYADSPRGLCPGCEAYREHQQ